MRTLFFLLFSILTFSQQTKSVDFLICNAVIEPHFFDKSISGSVFYQFDVQKAIDTIRIDAKDMKFEEVLLNGNKVKFKNNTKELLLYEGYNIGLNVVTFDYKAIPKQTLYFTGSEENLQIWTQGQGRYTSHWLPSFDDVNEKVIFNMNVIFKRNFTVIANGLNQSRKGDMFTFTSYNKSSIYPFHMQNPMSSYLVMLAIGNFQKQETKSKSGTPLEFYIDKKDVAKFEPTYRYSKQIFDYLEQEIGVKYPWKIYRQVPVRDFLYAGMENTTSTIFAQDFVVDSIGFNDKNYINVNAHELAHQWFGDLITAQSGKHHWLQEGFATYYALLAEKEVFGDDYFYNELYDYALQLRSAAKTDTIPVMNEKASSLSFYKKGAWALHTLREDIGAKKFQKAVKKYLKKYQYKNVVTDEFLAEVKKVAKHFDTENFKKKWLEASGFDMLLAESYLMKNKSVAAYIQLTKEKKDLENYKAILQSDTYFPIKQYIFYKLATTSFEEKKELIEIGMKQNLYVRQAIAETLTIIPSEFQKQYETFLDDASYQTREIALVNLSTNFPNEVNRFLNKLNNQVGNNDKNLRITWLKTTITKGEISEFEQKECIEELLKYASEDYESSIRENALDVLLTVNRNNPKVIQSLFQATTHHKWQFTKFSREKIRELLKNKEFRSRVEALVETADEKTAALYLKFLKE
ncbi:M1 family metallopeptidase [Flavobacterium difficile]|uniref:Aminopeptidase N n=1 Tax=Flavobacterium difficile TaxID=2709659 RepID=A0ABX0I3N5_9FLAO|nr:M1 family metallopeptidase [Flavobacterium difficile]NHM01399.1 M1 family metallopeptidase [Flavobacterium difficile]